MKEHLRKRNILMKITLCVRQTAGWNTKNKSFSIRLSVLCRKLKETVEK